MQKQQKKTVKKKNQLGVMVFFFFYKIVCHKTCSVIKYHKIKHMIHTNTINKTKRLVTKINTRHT